MEGLFCNFNISTQKILKLTLYKFLEQQEPRNLVTVGEFRLPETKVGTTLYFDFSQLIQARVMIFRLFGDVTAFVDDISELDGSGFRNLPLATGLSLANNIKPYYYADPYEVGKMGILTAV